MTTLMLIAERRKIYMKVVTSILICLGCIYVIYSIISLVLRIRKEGKENCIFEATIMQIVTRLIGAFVLIAATYVYSKKELESGMFFLCMTCNYIVDFIDRSITIKKK